MTEQLRQAVQAFSANTLQNSRAIREMLARDRNAFTGAAAETLRDYEETQGYAYLLNQLAATQLLLPSLVQLAAATAPSLKAVAKAAMKNSPLLQAQILQKLTADHATVRDAELLHYFDIVEQTTAETNLLPLMRRLVISANPQIRARAVAYAGKSSQASGWFLERFGDPDARLRANLIEAAWEVDSPDSEELFRRGIADADPAVRANAAVGLYGRGVVASLTHLTELAESAKGADRAAAAWAMGHVGDRRFRAVLRTLLRDSEHAVRTSALRSITKLRQPGMTSAEGRAHAQAVLLGVAPGAVRFAITGADTENVSIRPLDVHLEVAGQELLHYALERQDADNELAVAVLIPEAEQARAILAEDFDLGLAQRRRIDSWALLPYANEVDPAAPEPLEAAAAPPVAFKANSRELWKIYKTPAAADPSGHAFQAGQRALEALRDRSGDRHIVLMVTDASLFEREEAAARAFSEAAAAGSVKWSCVYAAAGKIPSWVSSICAATGGFLLPSLEGLVRAWLRHYAVTFDANLSGPAVLRIESRTVALHAEFEAPRQRAKAGPK